MDTWEDAVEYDSMDFAEVNSAFAVRAAEIGPTDGLVLDAGTGTARIPILMANMRQGWRIIGIDLSKNMLLVGAKNVETAKLVERVELQFVDAKKLPYVDHHFDMVVSNSIVHHIPDPLLFLREVGRVLKPGGALLIRDLLRPVDEKSLNALVATIGPEYDEHQKALFRDSLHASFTIDEVYSLSKTAGLAEVRVYQSSDRHWTLERSYGT